MGFKDMGISTRLALGFGALGLLIALMGALSLFKIDTVHDAFDEVAQHRVHELIASYEMEGDINQIARSMRNLVIMSDEQDIQKEVALIAQADKEIESRMARLLSALKSDAGRATMAKVSDARGRYVPVERRFMELAIAGKTFRYTEAGPVGLAGGTKVLIASSRGGFYGAGTPAAFLDHQETYLRGVFGFFGITDVAFIRAEGVAIGPEQRAEAVRTAEAQISALAA